MDGFWGNLIAGLIIFIVGLIFERQLSITKWPSLLIRKIIQKSPQRIRQSIFAIGWKVNVDQSASQEGGEIEVATPAQALGVPSTPLTTALSGANSGSNFILSSILTLITTESERLMLRSDYENGMQWVQNGDNRSAASQLVRAYNPVVRVFSSRGHTTDSNALNREVDKLSQYGVSGIEVEDINTTLSNIEQILHAYFQQNR